MKTKTKTKTFFLFLFFILFFIPIISFFPNVIGNKVGLETSSVVINSTHLKLIAPNPDDDENIKLEWVPDSNLDLYKTYIFGRFEGGDWMQLFEPVYRRMYYNVRNLEYNGLYEFKVKTSYVVNMIIMNDTQYSNIQSVYLVGGRDPSDVIIDPPDGYPDYMVSYNEERSPLPIEPVVIRPEGGIFTDQLVIGENVYITWSVPYIQYGYVADYRIWLKKDDGEWFGYNIGGTFPEFNAGIYENGIYYFVGIAIGDSGHESGWSSMVSFEIAREIWPTVRDFYINNKDVYTNSLDITLTSNVINAIEMRFRLSSDSDWTGWMTFQRVYGVTLPEYSIDNPHYTVEAEFKNSYGKAGYWENSSTIYSDNIIYDDPSDPIPPPPPPDEDEPTDYMSLYIAIGFIAVLAVVVVFTMLGRKRGGVKVIK